MKMTLEIETDDVAQLQAAHESIELHLRRHGLAPVEDEEIAAAVAAMWSEIGVEARRLLWFAAQTHAADTEFLLDSLAQPLGVNLDSVRAFHRNLARGLKARGIDMHRVMPSRKIGAIRYYHVPEPIHSVVRGLPLNPSA